MTHRSAEGCLKKQTSANKTKELWTTQHLIGFQELDPIEKADVVYAFIAALLFKNLAL